MRPFEDFTDEELVEAARTLLRIRRTRSRGAHALAAEMYLRGWFTPKPKITVTLHPKEDSDDRDQSA